MISKEKLKENVTKTKNTTKEALTTIYKALNSGQQKAAEKRRSKATFGVLRCY